MKQQRIQRTSDNLPWRYTGISVVLGTLVCAGCSGDANLSHHSMRRANLQDASVRHDELGKALGFLESLDQFEPQAAAHEALRTLNRWIAKQSADEFWVEDPMLNELPSYLQRDVRDFKLSELHFFEKDMFFVEERIFLRNIARSVTTCEYTDPLIGKWLAATGERLDADQMRILESAGRLFDWTVRSIQLETSRPLQRRNKMTVGPLPKSVNLQTGQTFGGPTDAGPGEMFYVWETLLKGRGDAIDRARVFVLLAQQQGIPVVMLGFEENEYVEPHPWLPAVLIANQLFLFDTALGLPIPRLDVAGIATLQDVLSRPETLRALDIESQTYPVTEKNVRRIVAWIASSGLALSKRMAMVERQLSGDRKTVLTVSPSTLADQLRSCPGVRKVGLWPISYSCARYRRRLSRKIKDDDHVPNPVARELHLVSNLSELFRGRILHFRGQIDPQEQNKGAKSYFLMCRPPDAVIEKLRSDPTIQRQIGLNQMASRELQARLQFLQLGKHTASYWLGQATFDNGEFVVARNWFEELTLAAQPNGAWKHGARYYLARTLEMLGEVTVAREIYVNDESPQRHGNLLRARFLE